MLSKPEQLAVSVSPQTARIVCVGKNNNRCPEVFFNLTIVVILI